MAGAGARGAAAGAAGVGAGVPRKVLLQGLLVNKSWREAQTQGTGLRRPQGLRRE